MKNIVRRLQRPSPSKRPSAHRARASRKSGPSLSLVATDRASDDAPGAPHFLDYELSRLSALALAMRTCDPASDLEFRMFIERGAQPENTGMERRGIAAELFIAPITLQRWSRGESLPFPLPRKAYLASLADLVDGYASRVREHGLVVLLDAPRRGARKSRTEDRSSG